MKPLSYQCPCLLRGKFQIESRQGETDWTSPQMLVILILAVLLGLVFIFYVLKLKGRLLP